MIHLQGYRLYLTQDLADFDPQTASQLIWKNPNRQSELCSWL